MCQQIQSISGVSQLVIEMVIRNQNNNHLKKCAKFSNEHVTCYKFFFHIYELEEREAILSCNAFRLDIVRDLKT